MVAMGTKTALTPADLLNLPDDDTVVHELSHGELITTGKPLMGHQLIKSNVLTELIGYRIQHPEVGRVFSESLFQLGPVTARVPDVAFLGAAKVGSLSHANIVIPVAPDIAVEVISESETAAAAETKVQEYLAAGVQEVWQFYPRSERVWVHLSDHAYNLSADQTLQTPLLPGFSVKVSSFFA